MNDAHQINVYGVQDDGGVDELQIEPTLGGFRRHLQMLYPKLPEYFLDRFSQQQVIRYKKLVEMKRNHLYRQDPSAPAASCSPLVVGNATLEGHERKIMGGESNPTRELDPPRDGNRSFERLQCFVVLPSSTLFPCAFESPICYCMKTYDHQRDWVRHVYSHIQLFTCTFNECREPRMFKTKIDWLRHINDAHRGPQRWNCNIQDCDYTTPRRNMFYEHLIREHKFTSAELAPAPKQNTGVRNREPIYMTQKIAECHNRSENDPEKEPCAFCSETFTTWRNLTGHLIKHFEDMCFPLIKLVEADESSGVVSYA